MEKVGRVCEHLVENTTGTPLNRLAQTTRELVKANPNFCTPTGISIKCEIVQNIIITIETRYGMELLSVQLYRKCSNH